MPLDILLAPFGYFGPSYLHFVSLCQQINLYLKGWKRGGWGGEGGERERGECILSELTFSTTHSFSIKLTGWHGAALLCNLDKRKDEEIRDLLLFMYSFFIN